jgi:hypothetical protein
MKIVLTLSLVDMYQCSEGPPALKMEAAGSMILLPIYGTTLHRVPEDLDCHSNC